VKHEEYLQFVENLFSDMLDLIRGKNKDYTAGNDNAFHNFEQAERVGVDALRGLYIRLMDKQGRIEAWFNNGQLEVLGEGIEDAFRDQIGYSALALGILNSLARKEIEKHCDIADPLSYIDLDREEEERQLCNTCGDCTEEEQEYLSLYEGEILQEGDEEFRPGGSGWESAWVPISDYYAGTSISGSSAGSNPRSFRRPVRKKVKP